MEKSVDVKTIVPTDLTGYIHKHKLEKLLKDIFNKDIKVIVWINHSSTLNYSTKYVCSLNPIDSSFMLRAKSKR